MLSPLKKNAGWIRQWHSENNTELLLYPMIKLIFLDSLRFYTISKTQVIVLEFSHVCCNFYEVLWGYSALCFLLVPYTVKFQQNPSQCESQRVTVRGAPTGGEGSPTPLGLEKRNIFRVSSAKLRDLHLWSVFFKLFAMWEDRGSLQDDKELT